MVSNEVCQRTGGPWAVVVGELASAGTSTSAFRSGSSIWILLASPRTASPDTQCAADRAGSFPFPPSLHLHSSPPTTARGDTRSVCRRHGEAGTGLGSFPPPHPHANTAITEARTATPTMYAPQYQTAPPGYMPYDYHRTTPPMSPGPGASYYSPRHGPQVATPTPRSSPKVQSHGHSRRASHAVPPQYSYASPRGGAMPQYGAAEFTSPRAHATPRGAPEYVSYFGYSHASRPRRDSDAPPLKRSNRERKRRPSQSARYVHTKVVYDDRGYGYECDYDVRDDHPPPPYEQYARHDMYRDADRYCHDQVPIYDPEPKSSRPRRASASTRQPATPKKPAPPKPSPRATEEDAARAGIPAGYSYKNWDPAEEPIMLLGSVFDANSLGKWIYDWTVFHYGPATPLAEMAGELWLLLIQLAGKVKRADETMHKIRQKENREMVEDFLESGSRLWVRFTKLLKVCEDFMWKAAKKESGKEKPVSMGKNSGKEFVESIFGRDRELEKTEKLMTGMRLWSMRFDANCEEILRYPSA
ncbi:hypothetical protein EJ02DRAFT_511073 [Clathrospora elynae]|uniref:Vegetative cell wall protein gp1 n=1 Tax=Clathrospora elynae TaxID=706981 RepID=A0A6A5SV85_9PLEO|nr:hypothetical protein EJ02DRAFT_511073 [Clathrospora elynae]